MLCKASRYALQGKPITGFTDSEERAVQLQDQVPFLLETRLRELGADFKVGPDFQPHTQRAGRLITGQNPASSEPADCCLRLWQNAKIVPW
jgi:putative intracellular protease/amidase